MFSFGVEFRAGQHAAHTQYPKQLADANYDSYDGHFVLTVASGTGFSCGVLAAC
jgi:hypothetical protein